MSQFVVGILSSITGAVLLYLVRFQIGFALNFVFRRYFPNVTGKYLWTSTGSKKDRRDAYPNQKIYLYLKQIANLVKGHSEVFSGDELKRTYSVKGSVSPTRVLRITFESETTAHHDYGVGLFKLDSENKSLQGYTSVLCVICQDTTSFRSSLKKLQN